MNIKSLVRDSSKVFAALQEMNDGKVVASKECKIYIPARFTERGLAELGATDTYILGICAIVVENFYAVMNVCAMMRIEPEDINRIKIQGVEYLEFTFSKGSTVITTLDLVKNDQLVYRIYDEIISKGKVPWYMTYDDLGHIFDTAKHHAGANIGENPEVTKLIVSMIARDRNDRSKYYRTIAQDPDTVTKYPPAYIPLKSVIYAATNTLNKLAGSYFSTGVVSALVDETSREERIDQILRR